MLSPDAARREALAAARRIMDDRVGLDDDPVVLARLWIELDLAAQQGVFPAAWTPFRKGGDQ